MHGKLRHPRLLGVRTDKNPRDVVREQPGHTRQETQDGQDDDHSS
jgi:hypothetical protein